MLNNNIVKKTRGRPKKLQIIENIEKIIDIKDDISVTSDITNIDDESIINNISDEVDDDFLNDFDNTHYKEEIKLEKFKPEKINNDNIFADIIKKKSSKKSFKIKTLNTYEDDTSLYSDKPTIILGKDKRVLLSKIRQYKNLFPEELSKFKIKKNCSTSDLQQYLDEMAAVVDVSSVETFLTDSILQCIKMTEGISSYTKYDISGCALVLKENKQFNTLVKQLYVKYNCFDAIPAEYSILLLVATTSYFCMAKNKRKSELDLYLNTPIEPLTETKE